MKNNQFDAEAWLKMAAPNLGFIVTEEQRDGVLSNLEAAAAMAEQLDAFELKDEDYLPPTAIFTGSKLD